MSKKQSEKATKKPVKVTASSRAKSTGSKETPGYRDRVETLVKESVTEENRGKVAAALGKQAHLIEKLAG